MSESVIRHLDSCPVTLCFHGIGSPTARFATEDEDYWVGLDQFRTVLDLVAERPHVGLTFDDGFASDVDLALPELVARGLGAAFFVVTDRLDHPGCLSREGVRALAEAGMYVGSHGHGHRDWRRLSGAEVDLEYVTARRDLEDLLAAPVDRVACPFGSYDRSALARARHFGYAKLYSCDDGWGRPGAWMVPRFTVKSHTTVAEVVRLLDEPPGPVATLRDRARTFVKGLR